MRDCVTRTTFHFLGRIDSRVTCRLRRFSILCRSDRSFEPIHSLRVSLKKSCNRFFFISKKKDKKSDKNFTTNFIRYQNFTALSFVCVFPHIHAHFNKTKVKCICVFTSFSRPTKSQRSRTRERASERAKVRLQDTCVRACECFIHRSHRKISVNGCLSRDQISSDKYLRAF